MSPYLYIAKIKIQSALAYRADVLSFIVLQGIIMFAASFFWIAVYGNRVSDRTYDENLKIIDEILNINELVNTLVRQLSLGQRMRGDLTAAMLHSPSVLFLDEPTIGLDVEAKYAIRKFLNLPHLLASDLKVGDSCFIEVVTYCLHKRDFGSFQP